jgi:hypothetical protein
MALPALPTFKINGPFWTADADLLRFATPAQAWNFRELFVDLGTRNFTQSKALLPGTLVVLCWVRTVTIAPTAAASPTYFFKRKTTESPPPATASVAEVKSLILSGQVALLLVEADPNQWKEDSPARLGTVTCLSGHIALDVLQGDTATRPALYAALDLLEAAPAADRPGASALPGRVSVHATGATLFGQARLPWEKARVTAPLQLARVLPDPTPTPGGKVPTYRLTVEAERLTPAERDALIAAWGRLAASVDPGNPELALEAPSCPRWVTLEVASPRDLPRMYWLVQPWKAAPTSLPLHLEREQLNLVLSDQAPFDQVHRPTTLARTTLSAVTIARTEPVGGAEPAKITITIAATHADGGTVPGELKYAASVQAGAWQEQFTLAGVVTAYDPIETPRALREAQDLATPEWVPGEDAVPAQPPILWGFSPLEDGWLQLPVPNLTTRMYVDARLASEPSPASALLVGAVAYGNDKRGALDEFPSEQAWTMTVLDASALSGTWTLEQQGAAPPQLKQIALQLAGPEVALSGLLWLSRGKPTAEDALPSLDDWVRGLVPVSLKTVDPSVDVIPPLATVTLPQLSFSLRTGERSDPSAALGAWSMRFEVDAHLFEHMVSAKLLPAAAFSDRLPLAWRRHRTLPMVQALPLTQSKSPPSHPSPSRQLVPFELPVSPDPSTGLSVPSGWTFGRAAGNGAATWPTAQGPQAPAHEWTTLVDLPLAALSLPGLVLDPKAAGRTGLAEDGPTHLPQQYRHDLPYLDEAHALAQLPKVPRNPHEVSPVPTSPRPEPPKPLTRELLTDHFRRLSERASLAALDGVAATSSSAGQARVDGLAEPLSWPVTAALATEAYPGSLTLLDPGSMSLTLQREAALEGVTGRFEPGENGTLRLTASPSASGYEVVAGSMAARLSNGTLRDQRGLLRGATAATARVLRTPARLVDETDAFELTSLLEAVPLAVAPSTAGGAQWRLWFRDLPAAGGTFLRDRTRSTLAQDVNDPEAGSRRFNHLNGWEWRLEPGPAGRYALFGLDFFPLTLEKVTLVGDDVRHVEIIGRLQLPVEGASEIDALANAVRLTFDWDAAAARLALSAVAPAGGPGEWPLALSAGASGDAPRVVWPQIALAPARDALHLDGAQLAFQSFGVDWRIPLARLAFSAGAAPIVHRYTASASPSEPLVPRQIELTVDPAGSGHAVSLLLGARLGRGVTSMPPGARPAPLTWTKDAPLQDPRLDGVRSAFTGDVRVQVLGTNAGEVTWLAGYLFDDITLTTTPASPAPEAATFLAGEAALEFRWDTYEAGPGSANLQLLPGMHLATGATPGFATVAFRVFTAANDVPTLHLTNAFVEALLRCRWGEFLQAPPAGSSGALARICGSSAGDLVFGYTGELKEAAWDEQYLLNGLLEVKNLISWPLGLAVDAADVRLTLPAARPAASLDHLRHTVRILFDQHAIPSGLLETVDGDLVFRFAPQKAWHFLAVVEHQLVDVSPGASFSSLATKNDRRWVAVQEVHVVAPASVKAGLLAIKNDALKLQLPAGNTALVGDAAYGLLGTGLRALLAEGTAPALDALPAGTMLVETSAVHWLKELPLAAPAATALQYLPNGTQLAALSNPEDYAPTDPRDPAWLLLQMPFLGRLQDRARDALSPAPGAPTPPALQVDPVLDLHRRKASPAPLPPLLLAFTAWAESAAANVTFSVFDNAVGRRFARLDPRALEESWFYVQNKTSEPPPEGIRSVLATTSDTVARLGRPTALAHLYRGSRGFYPPQSNPDGEPLVPDGTSDQLAWRPNHLFVLQAVASALPAGAPPYGWLSVGLQLVTGLLRRSAGATFTSRRHVAATQIPLFLAGTQVPSGLAVSPFLSLEFRPAPAATELRFVIAELLALNAATRSLRPVASQSWEIGGPAGQERELATTWARETHRRLSPESPFAVLRYRELRQAAPGASSSAAALVTNYGFGLVPGVQPPRTLAKRVFRLRSPVSQLRFRDGRFGGPELPANVRPFELAPPQTNGVQPLHLRQRPAATTAEAAWPWGFAGLRASVQYTEGKEGVTGRTEAADAEGVTLWWQSIQHSVQYRSGLGLDPAAGLPPDFRGSAIRSLLPVLPDLPLPALNPAEVFKTAAGAGLRRQPVLPGSVRTTIVGARAGAFLSLRPQLTRQSGLHASAVPQRGKGLTSGSVPAQHRAPRPVPLPPNDDASRDAALQPWASWFEPGLGLLARSAPADEAFFAAFAGEPAHRLQMKLVAPNWGQIDAEWDGIIAADLAFDGPTSSIDEWSLSAALQHGGRTVRYVIEPPASRGPGLYTLRPHPADAPALRDLLANLAPGDLVSLAARVARAAGADGFFQTLAFPLRAADPGTQRLPLEPFFVLFEDPEYNRLLASPSKSATGPVKTLEDGKPVLRAVTLSTDRAEYDPTSQLALRYDWDDDRSHAAQLSIDLIDATGLARPLTLLGARDIPMQAHTLRTFSLLELLDRNEPLRLEGGETLLLKLKVAAEEGAVVEATSLVVAVDVSAEPVTPVPQAAYALLRRQVVGPQTQVECVRFAFSPPATRVELVCPDDLRTGVVRRRAVFLWTDTARAGTTTGFAVQKIALTGSTHFPEPNVLEKVTHPSARRRRSTR